MRTLRSLRAPTGTVLSVMDASRYLRHAKVISNTNTGIPSLKYSPPTLVVDISRIKSQRKDVNGHSLGDLSCVELGLYKARQIAADSRLLSKDYTQAISI